MILEVLLSIIFGISVLLFGFLPNVPAMPTEIVTAGEWVINQVIQVGSILRWIYGSTLLSVIITTLVVLFTFEYAYRSILWTVKKIPFIDVK